MASIKKHHDTDCAGGDCNCAWRLDYRPQGLAGPRKRIEFPTKKAAEKYLAATTVKVSNNEYIEPAKIPTFRAVAGEWMTGKASRHPATIGGWRVHLRHLGDLDGLRLDKIDVATIERVRDKLCAKLCAHTVSAILTTAAAVFRLAIRRGYSTTNPVSSAERPRTASQELTGPDETEESEKGPRSVRTDEVLSIIEIRKMLEHSTAGLFRTLFATVAATGLRPEEAYALQWGDIEFDSAQILVRRALSWSRGPEEVGRVRPKFYGPKTRAGYRTLPLPGALVTALKVWKLQCPVSRHDLAFCRADGEPLQRSNVLRQGLYPALTRAKLRRVNVKTLRHSYASGLIAAGAPITEVQHRLGHSNPAVTLKVLQPLVSRHRYRRRGPFCGGLFDEPRWKWAKCGHSNGR